jgi:hypothetical protein
VFDAGGHQGAATAIGSQKRTAYSANDSPAAERPLECQTCKVISLRRHCPDQVVGRKDSWTPGCHRGKRRHSRPSKSDRRRCGVTGYDGLAGPDSPPCTDVARRARHHGAHDQTTRLRDSLRRHGTPHTCLTLPGEGHTLRRAETISRALEPELSFYADILDHRRAGDAEY